MALHIIMPPAPVEEDDEEALEDEAPPRPMPIPPEPVIPPAPLELEAEELLEELATLVEVDVVLLKSDPESQADAASAAVANDKKTGSLTRTSLRNFGRCVTSTQADLSLIRRGPCSAGRGARSSVGENGGSRPRARPRA